MYKIFLFGFFLSMLFSCTSKPVNGENKNIKVIADSSNITKNIMLPLKEGITNIEENAFGKIIELKGIVQKLDANINPIGSELLINGDTLIIMSPRDKRIFKFFLLPGFKLIDSFGIKGSGPNEFNYPYLAPTNEDDKLFYIYDAAWQKLYYIKNDLSIFLCNFKFPKEKQRASALKQIHVLSNRNMLYVSASAKGKKIYSFKPDSMIPETELKDLMLDEKYNNWAAYIGSFGVNKNKDRMVYAYNYFRELKFLNLKGTIEKKLIFEYKKPKAGNAMDMLAPTNITYYWKIYPCEESVYFSYSGKTPINWVKLKKKGTDFINIEQYNWNGKPLHKFKLDHSGYFCVDEKRNKLYLIATNAEEPFYVYDLPKK